MPILAAASAPPIATLAEAKAFLNIDAANTDHDAELQPMLDAACEQVEERCGPVQVQTFTETHPGDRLGFVSGAYGTYPGMYSDTAFEVALNNSRIQSITSLTLVNDGSSPIALSDLAFDSEAGTVFTKSGQRFPFTRWEIQYTAGFSSIPPSLKQAALIITKQLWESQRGNAGRPGVFGDSTTGRMGNTQATYVYTGFALPERAMELMAPFVEPAIA